jgi:hypothetical protein
MKENSSFQVGAPSDGVVAFLERAENADPNSPDFSADDNNANWGHRQLSGWAALLASWHHIGNTGTACRLIAAVIKTCKVARHMCFANHINTSTFLSDNYLQNIINLLWSSWKEALGIQVSPHSKTSLTNANFLQPSSNGNSVDNRINPLPQPQPQPLPPPPLNDAMPPPPLPPPSTSSIAPASPPENENENENEDSRHEGVGQGSNGDTSMRSRLQVLTKEELRDILKSHNMGGSSMNRHLKDGKLLHGHPVYLHLKLHDICRSSGVDPASTK